MRAQGKAHVDLPLSGKRVLVTRPAGQSGPLARGLRDLGAEPIELPVVRIIPPEDPGPLRDAVAGLGEYGWVIFTSANGVEALFLELERQGADVRRFGSARVCAIGPATAAALVEHGVRPDVIPPEFRGEAVAERILAAHGGAMHGVRVLLARAGKARRVIPDTLRAAGAEVDVVTAYVAAPLSPADATRLRAMVSGGEVDVVTFTASSTVENTVAALGADAPVMLRGLTVASIGPITTATAEKLGVRVDITAREYTSEGLLDALATHFRKELG